MWTERSIEYIFACLVFAATIKILFFSHAPTLDYSRDTKLPFSKWPMILNHIGSKYTLNLTYFVSQNASIEKFLVVRDTDILKSGGKSQYLTYDQLKYIPDERWKRPNYQPVVLLHPQSYNLTQILDALIMNYPVPEVIFILQLILLFTAESNKQ